MRIALFSDTYLPDINGVVSSVELLRKELVKLGHEVYVVSTYKGILKVKKDGYIIRLPGIEVKKLFGYKVAQPAHFLMIEELKKLDLELIHAHTEFGVGIFAGLVAKSLNIPLVRTYHTTYEDYTHYINFLKSNSFDNTLKRLVSFLSRAYGNACCRMISPSLKTAQMLRHYGVQTPIEVIPTGIDLTRFKPQNSDFKAIREECGVNENEKMVVYIGRIAQEKAIDVLLEAFELLQDEPLHLVIIGAGPQLEELEDLKLEKGLSNVSFMGKRSNDIVAQYYQASDVFVSASTSETQGLTYIEALACGIPVIARYDAALADLIQDDQNGYFFNDAQELALKLKRFAQFDEAKYITLKKEALKTAKQYDAEVFGKRMEEIYEEVVEEFEECYRVEEVNIKSDYLVLELKKGTQKEKLQVYFDDYYGIKKGDILDQKTYEKLLSSQRLMKAYRSCLRLLAQRDYSTKKMRQYLRKKHLLSSVEVEQIIDSLTKKKLLDDYQYAQAKFASMNSLLSSQHKIARKLKEEGIAEDIINELLEDNLDESDKALKLALKYQKSIHGKSLGMTKQAIIQKLTKEGYSYEDSKTALEQLDFSSQTYQEEVLLKREVLKLQKKYQKKYYGHSLYHKLYQALLAKGFNSEMIKEALLGLESEEEYEES